MEQFQEKEITDVYGVEQNTGRKSLMYRLFGRPQSMAEFIDATHKKELSEVRLVLQELDDHSNYADSLSYHAVSNAIAGQIRFKLGQHFNIRDRCSQSKDQQGILETRVNALNSLRQTANSLTEKGYQVTILEKMLGLQEQSYVVTDTKFKDLCQQLQSYKSE